MAEASRFTSVRASRHPLRAPVVHSRAPFRKRVLSTVSFTSRIGLLLISKVFFNKAWHTFQLATLCHFFMKLFGFRVLPDTKPGLQPLQALTAPVVTVTVARPLFRWLFPDSYRTAKFWRRMLPIYTRYMITKVRTRSLAQHERDKLWAKRHEWGGRKVHQLVLDMSGFYVKSAQILASKADFVPEGWRKWLSRHLDDAPPRPFAGVKKSIERELGACQGKEGIVPLETVFLDVDREPIAAASIAQVHGATLLDGTSVVIKVQHLGMDTTMHSDLRNLARVARFLRGQLPVDLVPIVKEIQATIPLEFNFEREVWFMIRIRDGLKAHGFDKIVCPSPVTGLCTKRLIVMQRLYGVPFTHILHPNADESLKARIPEVKLAVKHLLDAYGQMLLVDGLFHADPHAGNLLLLPEGRVGLLDYGQSKVLSEGCRKQVARMIVALASEDDPGIAQTLDDMGISFGKGEQVSLHLLAMMARMLFDTCYVEEATVSPMADNSILRKVPMTSFNQDLWLVVRTVLILRGLFFSLNIDLSAAAIWRPYAEVALVEC